jgi:hypothetical protein
LLPSLVRFIVGRQDCYLFFVGKNGIYFGMSGKANENIAKVCEKLGLVVYLQKTKKVQADCLNCYVDK